MGQGAEAGTRRYDDRRRRLRAIRERRHRHGVIRHTHVKRASNIDQSSGQHRAAYSGERFIGKLPEHVIKIVDVKCPDSGEADTFELSNLEALDDKDEVKFVLSTRRDYEFAREFTAQHQLAQRVRAVLFSPVFEDPQGKWQGLQPRTLVEWILDDGLPVRLGLQLHKFVWDPAMRGV